MAYFRIHALAQAADEPFRKPVAIESASGPHMRVATVALIRTKRDHSRFPIVKPA